MMIFRRWRYVCLMFALMSMTACNNVEAADNPVDSQKPATVTRTACLALEVKEDKIACLKKLTVQRKASAAETDKRIAALEKENEKRRERNEALLKDFEKSVIDED